MYGSLIYVSHCNHIATTISTTTGTGTTQGQSGWYMDFDGEVYYFAVDMYETWWQLVKQGDFDKNRKEFEVDDTPVLVADPLTRIGYPGFYREYHRPEGTGPKERVKAAASVYWTYDSDKDDGLWYPTGKKKRSAFMSFLFGKSKEEKQLENQDGNGQKKKALQHSDSGIMLYKVRKKATPIEKQKHRNRRYNNKARCDEHKKFLIAKP